MYFAPQSMYFKLIQANNRKKFLEDIMPTMLSQFEKMITPGGFFLGEQVKVTSDILKGYENSHL